MTENENRVLQVEGLHKKYRGFVIQDVNFSLDTGYIMGLIGRNGAGKTTVMKLIQNVILKKSGAVTICGYDNRKQEIEAKNEIGFVMDRSPFLNDLSLLENGELFGRYYSNFQMKEFKSYLHRFGMRGEKKVGALSKGMETRFQLAFALAHKPKLLVLDEPTDGLDPIFRREFLTLLQELILEMKMGVLISTHITSDLDKVADYITMIDHGKIIFSEDKEALMERYHVIKGNKELLQRIPTDKFMAIRKFSQGFEGMTENFKEVLGYCDSTDVIVNERATLEDIMYYLCKKKA